MNNLILIKHKWQNGVYELKEMIKFVDDKVITKEDFFDITRFHYDGIKKTKSSKNKKIMS